MVPNFMMRSLVATLLTGFALFWAYNLFGSQYASEESQYVASLRNREAISVASSRSLSQVTVDAQVIAEIMQSAEKLGLRMNMRKDRNPLGPSVPPMTQPRRKDFISPFIHPRTAPPPTEPPAEKAVATKCETPEDCKRNQCQASYGKAILLPKAQQKRKPPMLYTFPGSGNTWARLLIDKGSGVLSGSVYDDKTLKVALPGEMVCDWSVSVIKVHPHTHTAARLLDGGFHSDGRGKCSKGGIRTFDKAVLLIRDPYDSIWSIRRDKLDMVEWLANAANLANRYEEMWSKQYTLLEKRLPPENILYVRYEDLTNETKRIDALRSIIVFVGFEVSDERLDCAFRLATSKHAKRSVDTTMITKNELYTENKDLSCKMWATFGKYAGKHGYRPWGDMNCSDYSKKLIDINVGPAGSLNKKWMAKWGINMAEMKKGLAPVGDFLIMPGNSMNPQHRVNYGKARAKRGSRPIETSFEPPSSVSLVGLGELGKYKPAWSE